MDLEEIMCLLNNQAICIWSQFDAYEAAAILQNVLEQDKGKAAG